MLTDEELTRLISRSYRDDVPRIDRDEISRRATALRRHRRMMQGGLAALTAAVVAAGVVAAMTAGPTRSSDTTTVPTPSKSPPSGPPDLKAQEQWCYTMLTHMGGQPEPPRDPGVGSPIKSAPIKKAVSYAGPYAPLFVLSHGGGPRVLFYFDDKKGGDRFFRTYFCDGWRSLSGGGADQRYHAILSGVPYPPAPAVPFGETGAQQHYSGYITGFVPTDALTVSAKMPDGSGSYPGQVSDGVFVIWVPDLIESYGMTVIAKSKAHVYTILHGHMTTAAR